MALTLDENVLLTVITTLIVQFLKIVWVGLFKQPKPSAGVMRILAGIVALVYGYFASSIEFPVYEDLLQFIQALLTIAGIIVIAADRVYEVILKNFLGWLDAKVKGKLAFLIP